MATQIHAGDTTTAGPARRCLGRLVRRLPIDWRAIARETGCTCGTLCKTAFGWGIRDGDNGIDLNLCTVPETAEGESLRIEEGMWAIYRIQSNDKDQGRAGRTRCADHTGG